MGNEAEEFFQPPRDFAFDARAVNEILRILRALPAGEQADTLSLVIRRYFDLAESQQRSLEEAERTEKA